MRQLRPLREEPVTRRNRCQRHGETLGSLGTQMFGWLAGRLAGWLIGWLSGWLLGWLVAVWFGLISFPLYLWHWPLLSFARIVESETPSKNIRIAAIIISIVLAWLTYKFIEKPVRFSKFGNVKTLVLAVLMIVVGCVGHYTYKHDGLGFRIKDDEQISLIYNEFVGALWKYTKN